MKKVLFIFICLSQLLFSCTPDEELTQVTQDQINNSTIVIEIAPDYQLNNPLLGNPDTSYWFQTAEVMQITSDVNDAAIANAECMRYYMKPATDTTGLIIPSIGEFDGTDADITKWYFNANDSVNIHMEYKSGDLHYKIRVFLYNNTNNHSMPTENAFPYNSWSGLEQSIELDNDSHVFVKEISITPSAIFKNGMFEYNPITHLLSYTIEDLTEQEDLSPYFD